jgi:hypothetical protein
LPRLLPLPHPFQALRRQPDHFLVHLANLDDEERKGTILAQASDHSPTGAGYLVPHCSENSKNRSVAAASLRGRFVTI